jgi:hypothetical protein
MWKGRNDSEENERKAKESCWVCAFCYRSNGYPKVQTHDQAGEIGK